MADISEAPHTERYIFRGGEKACAEADMAFGMNLPREACHAKVTGERAALWLGPDEWLLLGNGFNVQLTALPYSQVDVSHRQIGIQLKGNHAADMLNIGCPLDLDDAIFTTGMCTRTVFGKAEIILWRQDVQTFHIEVWRSFGDYVRGLLAIAQKEYM